MNFKLQHQAGNFRRNRVTHTAGMTQKYVCLQCRQVITRYAFTGQYTKAGVDTVVRMPIEQGVFNDCSRVFDRIKMLSQA